MEMNGLLGARVGVLNAEATVNLGTGTLIGIQEIEGFDVSTPRILLDSGACVFGLECNWTDLPEIPPRDAFRHTLKRKASVYNKGRGKTLKVGTHELSAGLQVRIELIEKMSLDERDVVTAVIMFDGKTGYLLMDDLEFPEHK